MFRIALCLAAALLMSSSSYKSEIAYNNFLQAATSVSSMGGELSKSDALAVMRDYIKVNHLECEDYKLRLVGRVQFAQGDFYLLVYFDPVRDTEGGIEPQGDTFSAMPVFDDGYYFKVEAKTGNVEHYKTSEKFTEGK